MPVPGFLHHPWPPPRLMCKSGTDSITITSVRCIVTRPAVQLHAQSSAPFRNGPGANRNRPASLPTFPRWCQNTAPTVERVRRDAALLQNDFVDPTRRHVQGPGQCVLRQAVRLHEFFAQDFARVNRRQFLRLHVFHGSPQFLHRKSCVSCADTITPGVMGDHSTTPPLHHSITPSLRL